MTKDYMQLPVYQQKDRILDILQQNQVIVVQSPTGSGKTTQLPVILHEAGYSANGMIAVTQPRRIAALSVSEFIAKQLGTTYPGLVGYKMRFEDKTDNTTKIKIMTDGILLQEMKLDPWMSKYSVVMVDEAHERSLNIDFVLGLLKRVAKERSDFKIIISSATMNTELFSRYFDNCPIVTIDTITYPVTIVYDPPAIPASTATEAASEVLLAKIESTIERILMNNQAGDCLVFLPGEKIIKDCIKHLSKSAFARRLFLIPLYGRLAKEEQEKVFVKAPFGKKKVVLSTNIAETSVTIPGITSVIDSGLAKLNYYNPKTFTSSLNETAVSKASCNQRKGRAGRTQEGTCYRLYARKDFETRQMYTVEEVFRTDLSEVVLRMAELGITDFETFDFISSPNRESLRSAIATLNMLGALQSDNTLSTIGKYMVEFPLLPRQSRIIVEAIMQYPNSIEDVLIASAFLSAQSPFVLPPGEEMSAREAHHSFRSEHGDFVSYLTIFRKYENAKDAKAFCKKFYLDERVMAEIANIKVQLEQIVSDLGFPLLKSGSAEDYLTCIATGMIQFVCVKEKRDSYRSLTAEHIQIHPGSNMFKSEPAYIVAGEIVRTSRMFAMSVSPLSKNVLKRIDPQYEKHFAKNPKKDALAKAYIDVDDGIENDALKNDKKRLKQERALVIGTQTFATKKVKGKRIAKLPLHQFLMSLEETKTTETKEFAKLYKGIYGTVLVPIADKTFELLAGEKIETIIKIARSLNFAPLEENAWHKKTQFAINNNASALLQSLNTMLCCTVAKQKSRELGFITLYTNGSGVYWYKVSRGVSTALAESLASLEKLIDEAKEFINEEEKIILNNAYRRAHDLIL